MFSLFYFLYRVCFFKVEGNACVCVVFFPASGLRWNVVDSLVYFKGIFSMICRGC